MFFALQLLKEKQQCGTSFLTPKPLRSTLRLAFYPLNTSVKLIFMIFNLLMVFKVFIYKQNISSWFKTFKEPLKHKELSATSLISPANSDIAHFCYFNLEILYSYFAFCAFKQPNTLFVAFLLFSVF